MADVLGRTVLHRDRYARMWGLGDRKSPVATTPALVLMDDDLELPLAYAPFRSSSTSTLPSTLSLTSRAAFSPPEFQQPGPHYTVHLGERQVIQLRIGDKQFRQFAGSCIKHLVDRGSVTLVGIDGPELVAE